MDPLIKSQRTANENTGEKESGQQGGKRAFSSELAELIEAWPNLPPEFRATILGIVRSEAAKTVDAHPPQRTDGVFPFRGAKDQ